MAEKNFQCFKDSLSHKNLALLHIGFKLSVLDTLPKILFFCLSLLRFADFQLGTPWFPWRSCFQFQSFAVEVTNFGMQTCLGLCDVSSASYNQNHFNLVDFSKALLHRSFLKRNVLVCVWPFTCVCEWSRGQFRVFLMQIKSASNRCPMGQKLLVTEAGTTFATYDT